MALTLLSPAFQEGEFIPRRFTCDGGANSPELTWSGAPSDTDSYVLLMHDPDAVSGDFTHWIVFNIPDSATRIPESNEPGTVGLLAANDHEMAEYAGPCPRIGAPAHRYIFTLYALDVDILQLGPRSRRPDLEAAIEGHILDVATLTGYYQRTH